MLERLSDALLRGREWRASLRLMGLTAGLSAFLNNTAVVGSLLGVISRQRHIPASRLLIPLSFASILGGITTLVGTSTNLVVNSFVVNAGLPALGMFQFTLVGLPVALLCLLGLLFSRRFLPAHQMQGEESTQPYFWKRDWKTAHRSLATALKITACAGSMVCFCWKLPATIG
ncbi:hypothetical protein MBH78_20730 [Oceanimonas sp. NS1]|nr:hypothetical protein [Oceanimonas sp. NS1]